MSRWIVASEVALILHTREGFGSAEVLAASCHRLC